MMMMIEMILDNDDRRLMYGDENKLFYKLKMKIIYIISVVVDDDDEL